MPPQHDGNQGEETKAVLRVEGLKTKIARGVTSNIAIAVSQRYGAILLLSKKGIHMCQVCN